ncbi:MAG TPA: NADPH:quinone oxidoreductase family protein [Stellaceae bacterium]|nr:NADPH:quinone oxidoreductase family protein [Stellaceae bacterium]
MATFLPPEMEEIMRAVLCREYGAIEKLRVEEVPAPPLRDGSVRIALHAAGVNFGEMLMVLGQYQEKPALPFTPGFEAAGVVRERGAGVAGLVVGQRVMAVLPWGGYAEEAVVPAANVFPIPDTMDLAIAAGFPIAYGTAHGAFAWRAGLKQDEWLLVLGAAGGVGLAAVEIGAAMGARVIAAAGGADKVALARAHGASHVIDYRAEDIRERVKAITGGRGADVIFDPVGGDAFTAALRSVAWGGRVLVIGFASGVVPQIPANHLLVKNVDIMGFNWGSYRQARPALLADSFTQLTGWYAGGRLKPVVSSQLPLEKAAEAYRLLKERKATGKIVLLTGR